MHQRILAVTGLWLAFTAAAASQSTPDPNVPPRPDLTPARTNPAPSPAVSLGTSTIGPPEFLPLPGGHARLRYPITQRDVADAAPLTEQLSFRDRFLLAEIARQFPDLAPFEFVEVVDSRTDGSRINRSRQLALEGVGDRVTLERVAQRIDDWIRRNQCDIALTFHLAERDALSPAGAEQPLVRLLDRQATEQCLARLTSAADCDVLAAPEALTRGASTAVIQSLEQVPYVGDYNVEFAQGCVIVDPVVQVLSAGTRLEVTPIIDSESGHLLLEASLSVSRLKRPIVQFETSLISPPGTPVTVQLPELNELRWHSSDLQLGADDRAIHVSGLRFTTWDDAGAARQRELELLVQVRVLDPTQPSTALGAVIGFDPVSKLVFVRAHGQDIHELRAQRIEIRRDGTGVGQGLVIDASGGFLVIRLEDGEARRGDAAH